MYRIILCILIACQLPVHASEGDLLAYLKNYEGRWVGDYSIHSTANGYTESFSVEKRYWWKGEVLHGLAVSIRKSGMVTATSKTWVKGEKLIAEIKRGKATEMFYGVLHDGGLLWVPADMQRANDYQIHDSFVEKDGHPKEMIIEGFDTYIYGKGLAHLVYKGEFTLQPAEEAK